VVRILIQHVSISANSDVNLFSWYRLLEYAPLYYDLKSFPDGETKRSLQRAASKKYGVPVSAIAGSDGKRSKSSSKAGTPVDGRDSKKRRVG